MINLKLLNWRGLVAIIISLLLLNFTLSAQQLAQTNWRFSNAKPVGFTLYGLSFYDNNNGIAIGASNGCIAKTTDGGTTWKYGVFSFTDPSGIVQKPSFNDVQFVTPTVAYAAGSLGTLAKSTDAGMTWTYVQNPLSTSMLNVNAVWFINKDTGYIGGAAQKTATLTYSGITITSNKTDPDASPKLYFTYNGGATWDSIAAPMNGALSNIGYVNNPTYPTVKATISSWGKEIYRIRFVNDSTGYVVGGTNSIYERYQTSATATSSSAGNWSCLVWKVKKNVLTDYSVSKEKLGYTGITTATVTTTTTYNSNSTPAGQNVKAVAAINDSTILFSTWNNNMMVRIRTGRNDSTAITTQVPKVPGLFEVVYNVQPPLGYPMIPSTGAVFSGTNIQAMKKAPNGTIYFNVGPNGKVGYTTDNGTTFGVTQPVPTNGYYSYGLDVTPTGRVCVSGQDGIFADSTLGYTGWNSNYYNAKQGAGFNKIEFADCNNGIAMGGFGVAAATTNGGATWTDKSIAAFAASMISIYGIAYNQSNKLIYGTSNGMIYSSADQATTNDLLFADPRNGVIYDVASVGNRIWAVGWRSSQALDKLVVFRSFNDGATWDTTFGFPTGTSAPLSQNIKFATQDTGYLSASKGKVYRTINGGVTWTDISPVDAAMTTASSSVLGLYDRNTLYVFEYGYPNRRVYKSTDAGVTWVNITPNLTAYPATNISNFAIHDPNSVIISYGGGRILKTTDGGTTWVAEEVPTDGGFTCGQFVPKNVPAGTPMSNRKLFLAGSKANIFEYGALANLNVSSSESVVVPNCSAPNSGTITVTPTGGIAPYTYSLDGINYQTSNTFTGLAQGVRTIYIKDAGCQLISKPVTVGFNDNLTLTSNNDTLVCVSTPVQLSASSNDPNATYSWSPAAGLSNASVSNPIATVSANTSYVVTATLNGCSRTKTVRVNVKTVTVNAGTNQLLCAGLPAQLQATSDSTGVTYTWSPATGLSSTVINNPVSTLNTTQTYTVTALLNGCTKTSTVTINRKDVNITGTSPIRVCTGIPTQISVNSDSTAATFSWSPSTGLSSASIKNPVVTTTSNLNYVVTASLNGCTKSMPVAVTVKTVTVNAGLDKTTCANVPVQLFVTSDSAGVSYSWAPTTGLSNAFVNSPYATINNTTTYIVTATLNSCTKQDTITVNVNQNPVISAGPDLNVVSGYAVMLQGSGIVAPTSLAWTPNATLTQPWLYTPVAQPTVTTTYTLTVKDSNYCVSTDNMVVNVLPYCVKPMDAFTPNHDGTNDRWLVTLNGSSCVTKIVAAVYNRYGGLVFKDENYQNNWEGTYNGKAVPDGTYYYVLTYYLVNGPQVVLKGDVTILR